MGLHAWRHKARQRLSFLKNKYAGKALIELSSPPSLSHSCRPVGPVAMKTPEPPTTTLMPAATTIQLTTQPSISTLAGPVVQWP